MIYSLRNVLLVLQRPKINGKGQGRLWTSNRYLIETSGRVVHVRHVQCGVPSPHRHSVGSVHAVRAQNSFILKIVIKSILFIRLSHGSDTICSIKLCYAVFKHSDCLKIDEQIRLFKNRVKIMLKCFFCRILQSRSYRYNPVRPLH